MKWLTNLPKLRKKHCSLLLVLILSMSLFLLGGCSEDTNRLLLDVLEIAEQLQESGTEETLLQTQQSEQISQSEQILPSESREETSEERSEQESITDVGLTCEEDGTYTSKEEVALYLHLYGHLPSNFITKKQAQALGWDSSQGNLQEVAPGMSIGGDRFGNYEGILPEAEGREWKECDIDYEGGYRGSKRIVFSNDGLIYYTEDHYNSFELLYE